MGDLILYVFTKEDSNWMIFCNKKLGTFCIKSIFIDIFKEISFFNRKMRLIRLREKRNRFDWFVEKKSEFQQWERTDDRFCLFIFFLFIMQFFILPVFERHRKKCVQSILSPNYICIHEPKSFVKFSIHVIPKSKEKTR